MDKTVLDRWWPVTYDFGLIKSDVETVADAWSSLLDKANVVRDVGRIDQSLEASFSVLLPLSPSPTKELFLAASSDWTVFYRNGIRGSDPFLPMSQLSKYLGVMALRSCVSPAMASYPSVILEVYDTEVSGADEYGYRRSIAAANDGGGWVFEQSGEPFAFEDLTRFAVHKKRDRFTSDMMDEYLEKLGAPERADPLLQRDGTCRGQLFAGPAHDTAPVYSLSDAKDLN